MSFARASHRQRAVGAQMRRSTPPSESNISPSVQTLRVPPNSPQISASRILRQLISKNSLLNSASRCVRPGVALASEASSSGSEVSAQGRHGEGDGAGAGAGEGAAGLKDEAVARWERWRAEALLASRPRAPPFVFSLRTRRLPPQADGRVRSVPCSALGSPPPGPPGPSTSCERRRSPAATRQPQQLQRSGDAQRNSDTSGGEGKPLVPVTKVLCYEKNPCPAPSVPPSARSQRALRPAPGAPSVAGALDATARPKQISPRSSKQSQQSKEEEKPLRRQTVEAYVREKLSHLHPSDHFLKSGKKALPGDSRTPQSWFEFRRKTPLSSEIMHVSKESIGGCQGREEKEAINGNEIQQNDDMKRFTKKASKTQQLASDSKKCLRKSTLRNQSANYPLHKLVTVTSNESGESKDNIPQIKNSLSKITPETNTPPTNNQNQEMNKIRTPYQQSWKMNSNIGSERMKNKNFQQRPSTLFSSKRVSRRRVSNQSHETPFRYNLYRKPMFYPGQRGYKVTVINSGVVVYRPRNNRLVNCMRRKSRPIPAMKKIIAHKNSQKDTDSSKRIVTPANPNYTPPKEGILKYTPANEESCNQCPLRENPMVHETAGNICVLRSASSDSPITPSEKSILKQKAVRFELSEVDQLQKQKKPTTSRYLPDLLGADEIEDYMGFKESVDSESTALSGLYEMNSHALKAFSPFDTPGTVNEGTVIDSLYHDLCHDDRNIVTPLLGDITDQYGPQGTITTGVSQEQPTTIPNEFFEPTRRIVDSNAQVTQPKKDVAELKGRVPPARDSSSSSKSRGKCSSENSKPVGTIEIEESVKLSDILLNSSTPSKSTSAVESEETIENVRCCVGTTNIQDPCSACITYLPTRSKSGRKRFSASLCMQMQLRSSDRPPLPTPLVSPTETRNIGKNTGGDVQEGDSDESMQLQVLYVNTDRTETPFSDWGGLPRGLLVDPARRPDYSALKPPWPDTGPTDFHGAPRPTQPHGSARQQTLRSRELRASALSSRLPAVNIPHTQTVMYTSPPGQSTLYYLQKRLLEEQQAMRELEERRRRPSPLTRCPSPPPPPPLPPPSPPARFPFPFPYPFRARRVRHRFLLPLHRGVRSVIVR